jgi:8-oxo-dGTP pyrophosphatase MutT (NUDIX family)
VGKKTTKQEITREFSAGGVVFKKSKSKNQKADILWMVTKAVPSRLFPKSVWRLPKGWLDDKARGSKPGPLASGEKKATEDELQKAALREVEEEGGIRAKIVSKLGTEKYFLTISGKRVLKFVTFYLMEWESDLAKGFDFETEKVAWLPFEDAHKRLSYSGEKKILEKAKEILDRGIQPNLI